MREGFFDRRTDGAEPGRCRMVFCSASPKCMGHAGRVGAAPVGRSRAGAGGRSRSVWKVRRQDERAVLNAMDRMLKLASGRELRDPKSPVS